MNNAGQIVGNYFLIRAILDFESETFKLKVFESKRNFNFRSRISLIMIVLRTVDWKQCVIGKF